MQKQFAGFTFLKVGILCNNKQHGTLGKSNVSFQWKRESSKFTLDSHFRGNDKKSIFHYSEIST